MVLGLIDFLLGGKKKKVPKNAQVAASGNNMNSGMVPQSSNQQFNNIAGQNQTEPPANIANQNMQFQDSNEQNTQNQSTMNQQNQTNNDGLKFKKSFSEVINKIHSEMKNTNENLNNLVNEVKDIQGTVSKLDHRVTDLEKEKTNQNDKLSEIDSNMSKFLSLYEVVNNQYNPFIKQNDENQNEQTQKKEVILDSEGNSFDQNNSENLSEEQIQNKIKNLDVRDAINNSKNNSGEELEDSLLELDTLDIEEAAADAVPLTSLKTNTNSLVIILSWLEYLVKKAGIEEARNTLRYYTETLKWITPEVFFELDKYLRGMKDTIEEGDDKYINVRDHIVSLYFISKLNEKVLDKRLTNAVLNIIKK